MLKIMMIGGFNPFEFIYCPVCGGKHFTSLSFASVRCDQCNARFNVRYTGGDPGCVVDADARENVVAPEYVCNDCSNRMVTWDKPSACPQCAGVIEQKSKCLHGMGKDESRSFYWILKTGEYSSGWLRNRGCDLEDRPNCQKEWDEYQEGLKRFYRGEYDVAPMIASIPESK